MQPGPFFDRIRPSVAQFVAVAASSLLIGAACQTPAASRSDDTPSDGSSTAEANLEAAAKTRAELPQSDLVLWLHTGDAQLETAGDKVVQWKDASGQGNHLVAPGQAMQPSFVEGAWAAEARVEGGEREPAAVRFDGQDDMLMSQGFSPNQLAEVTVFIVAAPSGSAGKFDGLVSAGNRGAEDSFTGFNVDLGGKNFKDCADTYPEPTTALNTINVQSAKTTVDCGQDLLDTSVPFEKQTLLTVRIDNDETSLRLDGEPQRAGGGGQDTLVVPQLRLGVRFHRQKFQGYYDGTISEVIVYERSLSDEEIEAVETNLANWHAIDASE